MSRRFAACLLVPTLIGGCATVTAGGSSAAPSLCSQSRTWDTDASRAATRILPTSTSEENGRVYQFDLEGRSGLRMLHAECGWASYSECTFSITQEDGRQYTFSDLSTFSLWEHQDALYLLYRVVSPKSDAEALKRRLVKVGNPPVEVCSEIDYARLYVAHAVASPPAEGKLTGKDVARVFKRYKIDGEKPNPIGL